MGFRDEVAHRGLEGGRPGSTLMEPIGVDTSIYLMPGAGAATDTQLDASRHVVQFYRDDAFLIDTMAEFALAGLRRGDAVVIVGTVYHLDGLESTLAARKVAVDDMLASGRLQLREVTETLSSFMAGARPDPEQFRRLVTGLLATGRAVSASGRVRLFGEMVDVLSRVQDRDEGAVHELESLWREVANQDQVAVLCAYSLDFFPSGQRGRPFDQIRRALGGRSLVQGPRGQGRLRAAPSAEPSVLRHDEGLRRVTGFLVQALTPRDIASVGLLVVNEVLGAEAGSLSLVGGGDSTFETVACVGRVDSESMAPYGPRPLDARDAAAEAIRTRAPVFLQSPVEAARSSADGAGVTQAGGTLAAVPLIARGSVLGAMSFAFASWRPLADVERSFIRAVVDQCALALDRARLYEAERKARARAEAGQAELRLLFRLAEAVNRAETPDEVYEPALDAVTAGLKVQRASVLLADAGGVMRFRAWRGLSQEYRRAVEGHSPWNRDAVRPDAVLVEDVLADPDYAAFRDLFKHESIRALAFIPLMHRSRLIGKFMVYGDEPRVFSRGEVELAGTIAAQISQAVARGRLLQSERLARLDAERTGERMRRLQSVTAGLSEAVSISQVASVVVTQGLAATRAVTGGLWMHDESRGRLKLIQCQRYQEESRALFGEVPLAGGVPMPVLDVMRTGEPVWIDSTEELNARYPELSAEVRAPNRMAVACLPLRTRGRTSGVLAFTFEAPGALEDTQREFLLTVARQAELALERAELFEQERQARAAAELSQRRASFKAEAGALFASSLDYESALRDLARLAVPRFADWCTVEIGDPAVKTTLVASEPAERGPHPSQDGGDTGAVIEVQLTVHGHTVGVLSFGVAESGRRFEPLDVEAAMSLGQRAAFAVENARLQGDLRRAVVARDDLIAVVSHDLRNLLGVLSMNADSILRGLPRDAAADKPRRQAEAIRRTSGRMERLIRDLLDVGSIEARQLKLELSPEDVGALLGQAHEDLQPLALSKAVCLDVEAPGAAVTVRCDRQRVFQVLSNLVGNAIKFTSGGGSIALRCAVEGEWALFSVRDDGPGIEPVHLAHIFDRYYQGQSGEPGSMGLGLFIARGIVEAHGGRIWAESTLGRGSQFFFTLPMHINVGP